MNKSAIREITFKLLYSLEVQRSYEDEDMELFFEDIELESEQVKNQIKEDANEIIKNNEELEKQISNNLKSDWKLDRISKVNVALLKISIYEMLYKKVPYKVEEEYAYGGELTESEAALSKEEIDKIVFENMRKEGKLDSDESNYEVVIDGNVDNGYDTPDGTGVRHLNEETVVHAMWDDVLHVSNNNPRHSADNGDIASEVPHHHGFRRPTKYSRDSTRVIVGLRYCKDRDRDNEELERAQ